MEAVRIIKEEHRLILEFLDQLTRAGDMIARGAGPPREFFDEMVTFARQFADKFHHFKEEEIMFRLLAQKVGGSLDADLEQLKQQHERCRNYVAEIAALLKGYEEGSESRTKQLHQLVLDYVVVLRKHIDFENLVFLPKVGQELSTEELDGLADQYERWDRKSGGTVFAESESRLQSMAALLESE